MAIIAAIVPPLTCYIAAGSLTRGLTDNQGLADNMGYSVCSEPQSRSRENDQTWAGAHGDSAFTSQQRGEESRKQFTEHCVEGH
ncbi:hypothetical protein BDP55DRAFT_58885 [Colletotrichum godetiae]|uniref:Uncharacterized protein n=1 Tax=Colletotrichum godetiae TaxID=1209918 RepID=A0AAJ0APV4_9PEZI|nr:uncharacterized protein BDP55DRAFT_58885 [Colletotrichum godetiae]KAK1688176.1 hypothetical protein BDP55DRAFT_58885 [Colletotrichum godetiae]